MVAIYTQYRRQNFRYIKQLGSCTHTRRAEHPKIFAKGFSGLELMVLRREITDLHKHFEFFYFRFWRDLYEWRRVQIFEYEWIYHSKNSTDVLHILTSTFHFPSQATSTAAMPLQLSREMITFYFRFFPLNYLLFYFVCLRAAIAMLCVIFFSNFMHHQAPNASTYKRAGIGYDSRSSPLLSALCSLRIVPLFVHAMLFIMHGRVPIGRVKGSRLFVEKYWGILIKSFVYLNSKF